jgi:hypothetical protein
MRTAKKPFKLALKAKIRKKALITSSKRRLIQLPELPYKPANFTVEQIRAAVKSAA